MLENLVELFKQIRIAQNITQAELADKIGITDKAWSKIETGVNQLEIQHIGPICKALNLTDVIQELFKAIMPGYTSIAQNLQPETFMIFLLAFHTDMEIENPILTFKNRAMNGDFNPLEDFEEPDALPPQREPMDEKQFYDAKWKTIGIASPWKKQPQMPLSEIFRNMVDDEIVNRFI